MKALQETWEYRAFFLEYTSQLLRTRYRGSILGFLWTLLNPLLICLIFSFVFSYINGQSLKTFGIYFFSSYIPWMFFANSVSLASLAILSNTHYCTRIYVPKLVFPLAIVAGQVVDLLAGMVVILGIMLAIDAPMSGAIIVLPLSAVLTILATCGVSMLFAAGTVYLRDLYFVWINGSFLWFFLTPILYPIEAMPAAARPYFEMNPFLPFVRLFQTPLAFSRMPDPSTLLAATAIALVSFAVGLFIFQRSQRSFYLYL